jgi:sugar (pentulose or hexulose) kinase
MILVGIDVGTTILKSVAFDERGRLVAVAKRPSGFLIPRPNRAECDMERLWSLVGETLTELVDRLPPSAAPIRAVGLSGYMGGAWLIDSRGSPVRQGILWNDGRSMGQLAQWQQEGIIEKLFHISCNATLPGFSAPLLRWLKENEPAVLDQAGHFLFAKDWIRYRLTGELCTEESDAIHFPGTIEGRGFSQRILELTGVGELSRILPPVLSPGQVSGRVHRSASLQTGLPEKTLVAAGLADASASLVGAGALRPGDACCIVGTSCLNCVTTPAPVREPPGVGFCFLLPNGTFARCMPNTTGTMAGEWFKREILGDDTAELDEMVERVPPGARGVIFHPYLNSTGVLAPLFAPRARARFWGLGVEHTRLDMLRAVYEGVAFAMADCLEHLPDSRDPVLLVGGGSRSPVWRQIFADVTGRPMMTVEGEEPGAMAAAMCAGISYGVWHDFEEAVAACCRPGVQVEPRTAIHSRYQELLPVYQYLRRNLAEEPDLTGTKAGAPGDD